MSHEIRTPLNGILGFTDLLLKNPALDADSRKQLEYIMMSGDILLVIINDILDLAKIESGQIALYEKPFELSKLIQLVYDAFSMKVQEKDLSFETSIDKKIPVTVNGDSVRVAQILFNLISNAVKFTPPKGTIILKIDSEKEDSKFHNIKITVKDTGIGISADRIEAIFDPFIQVSDDTARKYGGTGLGLTIIKKIINMMNGRISVESEPNVGTIFTVHLPFAKESSYQTKSDLLVEENEPALVVDKNKKIKVLLAEDNRINQLLAQKVLLKFDFECFTVENGSLAVEAVSNENFDIVLMDIMMPVMNGYEATALIRNLSDETKKNIPIIALTAVVTGSIIEDCEKAGMNSYLSKPFASEELYKAIAKLVY
jgi:two-component system CheB/CheR fusion protein